MLRWAPPVIVAIWATGVYAIARPLLGGTRGPWVATWLFCGFNWIEQDYFSPQATAMVLMLAVLACVLGPLATRRGDPAGRDGWARPRPGAAPLPLLHGLTVAALAPPLRPVRSPRQMLLPRRSWPQLWPTAGGCSGSPRRASSRTGSSATSRAGGRMPGSPSTPTPTRPSPRRRSRPLRVLPRWRDKVAYLHALVPPDARYTAGRHASALARFGYAVREIRRGRGAAQVAPPRAPGRSAHDPAAAVRSAARWRGARRVPRRLRSR